MEKDRDRDCDRAEEVGPVSNMYFSWMPYPSEGGDDASSRPGVRREIVLDPCADRDTLVAAIETMTLEQIGIAWRATTRLMAISTPQGATQLVRLRELLLDEVEASHPRAFRRWLRKGGPGNGR
jgi:hypothetical protein